MDKSNRKIWLEKLGQSRRPKVERIGPEVEDFTEEDVQDLYQLDFYSNKFKVSPSRFIIDVIYETETDDDGNRLSKPRLQLADYYYPTNAKELFKGILNILSLKDNYILSYKNKMLFLKTDDNQFLYKLPIPNNLELITVQNKTIKWLNKYKISVKDFVGANNIDPKIEEFVNKLIDKQRIRLKEDEKLKSIENELRLLYSPNNYYTDRYPEIEESDYDASIQSQRGTDVFKESPEEKKHYMQLDKKTELINLSKFLKKLSLLEDSSHLEKLASELPEKKTENVPLLDYDEPWHEEIIKEYGEEPVSEEEYFENNFSAKLNEGESGFTAKEEDLIYKQQDEVHKQRLNKEFNELYQKALDKEDLPLMTANSGKYKNNYTPFLGGGQFGRVYRVLYNGKEAAAKVMILDQANIAREIINSRKIKTVSETAPPEVARFFPTIYGVRMGKIEENSPTSTLTNPIVPYGIIITEKLIPLSLEMHKLFYNLNHSRELQGNSNLSYEAIDSISNSLLRTIKKRFQLLQDIDPNKFFKMIFKVFRLSKDTKSTSPSRSYHLSIISKKIAKWLMLNSTSMFEYVKTHNFNIDILENTIYETINKSYFSFPVHGKPYPNQNLDIVKNDPLTGPLYQALEYVKQHYKLEWHDVHAGNIMQDKSGQLKVIDFAFWKDLNDLF